MITVIYENVVRTNLDIRLFRKVTFEEPSTSQSDVTSSLARITGVSWQYERGTSETFRRRRRRRGARRNIPAGVAMDCHWHLPRDIPFSQPLSNRPNPYARLPSSLRYFRSFCRALTRNERFSEFKAIGRTKSTIHTSVWSNF